MVGWRGGGIPGVFAHVFALYLQRGLWGLGLEDKVVVAVGTVLVAAPRQCRRRDTRRLSTYASSNSRASLRKAFLHFLQMKVMSNVCMSAWLVCSAWHSAQSNHFLPRARGGQHASMMGGPGAGAGRHTAGGADGDLGVEDVLAAWVSCISGLPRRRWRRRRRRRRRAYSPHGGGVVAVVCILGESGWITAPVRPWTD